jgi:hypothetical protein
MATLVWSPVYRVLEDRIQSGDETNFLIVPFIKVDALRQLHWIQTKRIRAKVICRWLPGDLIAGVSDVEVFTYLKAAGCQLYVNNDIHMKLYVFESNIAFNTSANLTLRGLGYGEPANIEVGSMVTLTPEDWANIYRILLTSRQVDDAVYERAKAFVENNPRPGLGRAEPDFFDKAKVFTIGALPAMATPAQLASYYFAPDSNAHTPEVIRRATHDLVAFDIPPGLTNPQFEQRLGDAFRKAPFVVDFVAFLKAQGSLRFGAVNDWLHQKCEDVPLPYRWQIKENTAIFYDWLAHYVPGVSWDRPNYSQVIYWRSNATN